VGGGDVFEVWALDVEDGVVRAQQRIFDGVGAGLLAVDSEGEAYVTTSAGLVSMTDARVARAGDGLGRCYFDDDEIRCVGEAPLECDTLEGLIYRGAEAPTLWGALVYACENVIRAREWVADAWVDRAILTHEAPVTGLFVDRLGRLHGHDSTGRVLRLRLAEPDVALGWPATLSETHCLDVDTAAGPDLIPYRVNAQLWTDGAEKRRWLVLPPGASMTVSERAEWVLPVGSVLIKQFDLPDQAGEVRPVETRIMHRWPFGWSFHSYRWRDDGSDADLLDGADSVYRTVTTPTETFEYLFPRHRTCRACHQTQAKSVLGLSSAQLVAGPPGEGQLDRLLAVGAIDRLVAAAPMPDPADPAASLHARARATLHTQCAHCHQPRGWAPPDLDLDLRWTTPWADSALCDVPVQYPALSTVGDVRLVPGRPEESAILTRQTTPGFERMPPFAGLVDPRVEALLRPWILGMNDCGDPEPR
jgi:hypothetical protein